ncbi:S8 family serine peptidase, partial [Luminiphilus sp.]|nr:S8 family serine peptidase [Luminiphilus sp.]
FLGGVSVNSDDQFGNPIVAGIELNNGTRTAFYDSAIRDFDKGCIATYDGNGTATQVAVSNIQAFCKGGVYAPGTDIAYSENGLRDGSFNLSSALAVQVEGVTSQSVAVDNGSSFAFDQTGFIGAVSPNSNSPWWDGWLLLEVAGDNCPLVSNPDQDDHDGDGLGDSCDYDDDNDGADDTVDAFPRDDSESIDTDGDGKGNNSDVDDDDDGIEDLVDNCPLIANNDQGDDDSDGVGNACDADWADTTAPVLMALNLSPSYIDVSSGPLGVVFDLVIEDASNIDRISLWLGTDSPDGSHASRRLYWYPQQITDGCGATVETYSGGAEYTRCQNERVFDADDRTGIWTVNQVEIVDIEDNKLFLDGADLESVIPEPDRTFEVAGGSNDHDAPVLTSLSISPRSVDVSSGPKGVRFDLGIDDESNIERVYMWLRRSNSDGTFVEKFFYWEPEKITDGCGTLDTGTYAGGAEYSRCQNEQVFDSEDSLGTWMVDHIEIVDAAGNSSHLDASAIEGLGIERNFEVTGDGTVTDGDTDSDGDGVADVDDAFPDDATETTDTDGDGVGDNADDFPNDATIQTFKVSDSSYALKILPATSETYIQENLDVQISSAETDGLSASYTVDQPPSVCESCLTLSEAGSFEYTWPNDYALEEEFKVRVAYSGESLIATITISAKTDPLYKYQWHLDNTGQDNFTNYPGVVSEDLRVEDRIRVGYTGSGVKVAVVDDGLEIAHEDLSGNVVSGSKDFADGDNDPTNPDPTSGHGTAVAGIIAAEGWNNKGGRGVAPSASLVGYNYLESQSYENLVYSFGGASESGVIDIFNASLGGISSGLMSVPLFDQDSYGYEQLFGTLNSQLRDGLGALIVKSSGNDFDAKVDLNSDGEADPDRLCGHGVNDRVSCVDANTDWWHHYSSTMVTAALRADGIKSSYSSPGSVVWISGFGGEFGYDSSVYSLPDHVKGPAIMTTDKESCESGYSNLSSQPRNAFEPGFPSDSAYRHPENLECNYVSTMNGTSSAAPSVSGVLALMLDANRTLSARDMKHIVAQTARVVDPNFAPVVIDGVTYHEWRTNGAGFSHHNWYGFGAINAQDAVIAAEQFDPQVNSLGGQIVDSRSGGPSIVADFSSGLRGASVLTSDIAGVVELTTVKINLSTQIPNGYGVRLVSPAGTVSTLLQPNTHISALYDGSIVLTSAAFYGESTSGDWTLEVYDHRDDGLAVEVSAWQVQFHYRTVQ